MKKYLLLVGVFAHTLLLAWVSYLWLNLPYTYENEGAIIAWSSIIKNIVFGFEEKPDKNEFLLVNTSYQKTLIPKTDEFGFEIGTQPITDRQSLADFFTRAATTNQHKFIVCDVFLESPSGIDSILLSAVSKTERVRFPYHRENGDWLTPALAVPVAFSDYTSDFGNFLKYSYLQYDTCKSMALEMYRTIDKGNLQKSGLAFRKNGNVALNSFIIEFPIRQFDIFREDTLGYSSMHLQNFLTLPDSLSAALLKDKIVVVGDFLEDDMHQTIYGTTAGPLIHLNAYLNLRDNRNDLSWLFFLYMFTWYLAFSYILIFNSQVFSFGWTQRLKTSKAGGFVFDYFKYAFFLLVMSVTSFLLFDVHLNVLIISLYFSLAEYGVEFLTKRFSKETP